MSALWAAGSAAGRARGNASEHQQWGSLFITAYAYVGALRGQAVVRRCRNGRMRAQCESGQKGLQGMGFQMIRMVVH